MSNNNACSDAYEKQKVRSSSGRRLFLQRTPANIQPAAKLPTASMLKTKL
jgi:hypothetical protein